MGDRESYAALAQQVDELRGELATFRARLDVETGPVMVVQAAQKRQREKLDELEKKITELAAAAAKRGTAAADEPTAPRWDISDRDALDRQGRELHQWVEEWLRPQFPGYLKPLPDCWPNHREALWELGTLHASWKQAIGEEAEPGLDGVRWWLDRWLPGTLSRLRTVSCSPAGCSLLNTRPAPRRPPGAYPPGPAGLAFRDRPQPPA